MADEVQTGEHNSLSSEYKELLRKIMEVQGLSEEIVLKLLSAKGIFSKDQNEGE